VPGSHIPPLRGLRYRGIAKNVESKIERRRHKIKKAASVAAFFQSRKSYAGRTFSACQPLGPLVTSNWTV